MRSNLLTTIGVALVLASVVLLGYWQVAVGLAGVALLTAGYVSNEPEDEGDDGA